MKQFLLEVYYRFAATLEKAQGSQRIYVLLVYFSILLDNLLLTAVGKQSCFLFSKVKFTNLISSSSHS